MTYIDPAWIVHMANIDEPGGLMACSPKLIGRLGFFKEHGVMPVVLNRRNQRHPGEGVYVGRPTVYGNPFVIGEDGTREDVVEKYERYITGIPNLMLLAKRELRGRNLICWCAPLPCHADVLLRIANED